jgi:PAS domain S-box-containing protein
MLAVIKASQAISEEMILSKLVDTLLRIAIEQAGAQRGLLLFPKSIEADTRDFSRSIANYVMRTKEKVILDDASKPNLFSPDPYLSESHPKSILCLPIMRQAKLIGLLYLENNLLTGAFTPDRIAFLELVSAQSAISLENAKLYENLRESEAQFRQLIEYSPIGIALAAQSGEILYLNRAFVDNLGYTLDDIPNIQTWWVKAYPDEKYRQIVSEKWAQEVDSARQKTGKILPSTYNVTGKDGTDRIVEATAVLIGDKFLVLFNDITERKQAEDELKQLNETLEQKVFERTSQLEKANNSLQQADRLKDEFLSAISHELRSPLNAITGFGSILDDEVLGPLNERQHESLDKLLKSSERMLSLINDLLDFAWIRAGKFDISPVETEYPPLVDEVVTGLCALAYAKNLELETEIDVPVKVMIDPQRIAQVLTNLVSNSIKFTPLGGRILIRAFIEKNQLVTEVRDTGVGIEPRELSQLFTPFKQLEAGLAQRAGSGLGLSISKGIVEAHGGTISAESPGLGMGATFRFKLPLS